MYYVLLIWMLGFYYSKKKPTNGYIFAMMLPLFLMVAFRSADVGSDTSRYLASYLSVRQGDTLADTLDRFGVERGYIIFIWFLRQIGLGEHGLFFSEAIIFVSSIIVFCKRNTKDVPFMLVATSLSLQEFALTGIRQTIAISIFLIAYEFAVKRKYIIYTALILLASTFHTSIWMVYPLAFLINRSFDMKSITIYLAILVFAFTFMNSIFSFVASSLEYDDRYVLQSLNAGYYSFFASLIFVVMLINSYRAESDNEQFRPAAHLTIMNCMFSAIRFVNVMIMRVILYVSCFPYLMIDMMNDYNPKKNTYKKIALVYLSAYIIYRTLFIEKFEFSW
ncbi:MAG: EpsG family protein [Prevotella sp.]|nr:EpsG family protein [Prevotella sp.]